jgi:hypothetical protein
VVGRHDAKHGRVDGERDPYSAQQVVGRAHGEQVAVQVAPAGVGVGPLGGTRLKREGGAVLRAQACPTPAPCRFSLSLAPHQPTLTLTDHTSGRRLKPRRVASCHRGAAHGGRRRVSAAADAHLRWGDGAASSASLDTRSADGIAWRGVAACAANCNEETERETGVPFDATTK